VRLGAAWSANEPKAQCGANQKMGNVLQIKPGTRFSYRYDGAAVHDLAVALSALPAAPVILIAGGKLERQTYDTAWRAGVALERAGKHAKILALPAIGDLIDLNGITVPAGLETIPAFAGIAKGGKLAIKDTAEVGALLALGQEGPLRPDLVVADPLLVAALGSALDALGEQLQHAAPDAAAAYGEWRARAMDPVLAPIASNELRLATAVGRPAVVMGQGAGLKAATLFSKFWQPITPGSTVAKTIAAVAPSDPAHVSMQQLGGLSGRFEVRARHDWNAGFDLAAISRDGWMPAKAVFDVIADAAATGDAQVASVYLNDVLLGARRLKMNGVQERIAAEIPAYALASHNVLRLSLQRQLADGQCAETLPPSSTSVLPSSHVLLEHTASDKNFLGMITYSRRQD